MTPDMELLEERGRGVLHFAAFDVSVGADVMDALAELIGRHELSLAWQEARDLLAWSNSTSCHVCTRRPVVERDDQGRPRCSDCQRAALMASRESADSFSGLFSSAGDCV